MRQLLTTITLISLCSLASANNSFTVQSVNSNQCQVTTQSGDYVRRVCPISLANNDHVVISGVRQRSNLEVQRGNQNDNPFYMPLGVDNATYDVEGNIDVVYRRTGLGQNVRHALVYKLSYQTYDGQRGYQIITVRLGSGIGGANRTCMVYAFDSHGATRFAGLSEPQKEQAMRQQALSQIQGEGFQSSHNQCLEYEHNHEERQQPATLPIDPNEGDSLEVGI